MKWMTAILTAALMLSAARARSQDVPAPVMPAVPQPVVIAAARAGGIPSSLAMSITDRGGDLGRAAQLAQKALP